MNFETACKILDIDNDENVLSSQEIKRKYRIAALLYHPDKNKSEDAVSQFQQVQNAYEYLLKYENFGDLDADEEYPPKYNHLLFSFLRNIIRDENPMNLLYAIFSKIAVACESTILENLDKLDQNTLLKIHEIVKTYQNVLHIGSQLLEKIDKLVSTKQAHRPQYIILNPLIEDLQENNLYKMTIGGDTVIVIPLWHHELVYDSSVGDVYVKCLPILPDNIRLDEENNLHVQVEYDIVSIWNMEQLDIPVGKKTYQIERKSLAMTEEQTVVLSQQGISRINTTDVYDVSQKSDVVLHFNIKSYKAG